MQYRASTLLDTYLLEPVPDRRVGYIELHIVEQASDLPEAWPCM